MDSIGSEQDELARLRGILASKLPCSVRLPPATTIVAGCTVETLLTSIDIRREESTPEHAKRFAQASPDDPTDAYRLARKDFELDAAGDFIADLLDIIREMREGLDAGRRATTDWVILAGERVLATTRAEIDRCEHGMPRYYETLTLPLDRARENRARAAAADASPQPAPPVARGEDPAGV